MPTKTPAQQGPSEDTRTIVTVLLIIFMYPVGIIVMWFWVKWPLWLKILLSLLALPVIAVIGMLAAVTLIAINPAEQMLRAECVNACQEEQRTDCVEYCANLPFLTPTTTVEEAPVISN